MFQELNELSNMEDPAPQEDISTLVSFCWLHSVVVSWVWKSVNILFTVSIAKIDILLVVQRPHVRYHSFSMS